MEAYANNGDTARCARAAIPYLQCAGRGRFVNIRGLSSRCAGNLSGGARNVLPVHLTRTGRTAATLAARAEAEGCTAAEVEVVDCGPGRPRGNAIGCMADAAEIGSMTTFPCTDKAWTVKGSVIAADDGGSDAVYSCPPSCNCHCAVGGAAWASPSPCRSGAVPGRRAGTASSARRPRMDLEVERPAWRFRPGRRKAGQALESPSPPCRGPGARGGDHPVDGLSCV